MADRCRINFFLEETKFPFEFPQGDVVFFATEQSAPNEKYLLRFTQNLANPTAVRLGTQDKSLQGDRNKRWFSHDGVVYFQEASGNNIFWGYDATTGLLVDSFQYSNTQYGGASSVAESRDFIYFFKQHIPSGYLRFVKYRKGTWELLHAIDIEPWTFPPMYHSATCYLLNEDVVGNSFLPYSGSQVWVHTYDINGVVQASYNGAGAWQGYSWNQNISFYTLNNNRLAVGGGGDAFFGDFDPNSGYIPSQRKRTYLQLQDELLTLYPAKTSNQCYIWPYVLVTNGNEVFLAGDNSFAGGLICSKTDNAGNTIAGLFSPIGGKTFRTSGQCAILW